MASLADDFLAVLGVVGQEEEDHFSLSYWCPFINLVSKARQVINIAATLDK